MNLLAPDPHFERTRSDARKIRGPETGDQVPKVVDLKDAAAPAISADLGNRRDVRAKVIANQFPELRGRYSSILFNQKSRAAYLSQLHKEVDRAAKRLSLSDRIAVCF